MNWIRVPLAGLVFWGTSMWTMGADVQAERVLTLAEARATALRNHPRISAAELKALAAREVVAETRSAFFPIITFNATAVGTSQQNTRIAAGSLSNPAIYERYAEGFAASQLITDFGRSANLAASSRLHAQAEERNTEATRAQVVLAVDTAYFSALAAQSVQQVAEQTVATRQLLSDQISTLASNQLRSELDANFARVSLEEGQILLVKSENDVKASMATLSMLLGDRGNPDYRLSENTSSASPVGDIEPLMARALLNRPELARLRLEHDAAERFARAEKALNYPTISAVGAAGVIPVGDSVFAPNYAAAGVNFNLPIFAGGLFSARHREAELKARASEESLREEEDNIVRDVRIAWLDVRYASERLRLTENLVTSARQTFELAQARYRTGSSSIVELSQAQLNLTGAEIAHATARYEFQTKESILDYQTANSLPLAIDNAPEISNENPHAQNN